MATTTTTTTATATILRNIQDPLDTKNVFYQSGGYRLSRPVLTGKDAKKTFDTIPTVDVGNIFSEDAEVRRAIAKQVGNVCEEVGFFYAVNAPVSRTKMDAAMNMVKTFFRMPQEELLKLHVDNSQGLKGYLPFKFKDGSDRRASYSFGRDYTNPEQHFVKKAPEGTVPLNQWPDDALPEFRKTLYEYYREVFKFAEALLRIFAMALDLEETAFDSTFACPLNDITMQYYPIQSPDECSSIVPHADYGGLTLLYQDDVGGLEVLNANGIWVPAPPKDHAYVINTGSYMEVLSNGRFPATVHRAFGNPRSERFSLPFFYNPSPDAIVAPPAALLAPKNGAPQQESRFAPQDVSRRQIKGLATNRPHHPFFQKLRALGFQDDDLTFDLVAKPMEEIEKMAEKK